MRQITINNKLITSSLNNNYKLLFFGLILIIYFIWMDIALFVNLQRWTPPPIETSNSITSLINSDGINNNNNINNINMNVNQEERKLNVIFVNQTGSKTNNVNSVNMINNNNNINNINNLNRNYEQTINAYNYADPFSIFKPLSVKLIMIDHVTHYVHDILARFLADTLHFTRIFPWVTANLVSFTGLGLALLGCRLTLSDKLFYRQIGALLFEARNLADSLDGVVYRARKREMERLKRLEDGSSIGSPQVGVYQSFYGTFGYNVDVICDGLAGLFFVLAIFIRFLRHPPHKNSSSKLLLNSCKPDNYNHVHSHSHSNFNYHRLESNENYKYECVEMDSLPQYGEIDQIENRQHKSTQNEKKNCCENSFDCDNNRNKLIIHPSAYAAAAFASTNDDSLNTQTNSRHFSSRQVKLVVISFGIRLLFTGLIWDHYVHKYHDLLMVFSMNPTQRRMQGQAFKSVGMWLIMWFWRIGNACAILEHLVIGTFFDKLWEYLVFTSYIGWAYLIILTLFTQIHYTELYESLNSFAAVV